jgi:hypothetical protein
MTEHTEPTYTIRLFIAGEVADARRAMRQECLAEGLCVTVTPTTFVYTAGAEEGVEVGFVNYPRFPTTPDALFGRAKEIAVRLMARLCQRSALLVAPDKTLWLNDRPKETP